LSVKNAPNSSSKKNNKEEKEKIVSEVPKENHKSNLSSNKNILEEIGEEDILRLSNINLHPAQVNLITPKNRVDEFFIKFPVESLVEEIVQPESNENNEISLKHDSSRESNENIKISLKPDSPGVYQHYKDSVVKLKENSKQEELDQIKSPKDEGNSIRKQTQKSSTEKREKQNLSKSQTTIVSFKEQIRYKYKKLEFVKWAEFMSEIGSLCLKRTFLKDLYENKRTVLVTCTMNNEIERSTKDNCTIRKSNLPKKKFWNQFLETCKSIWTKKKNLEQNLDKVQYSCIDTDYLKRW